MRILALETTSKTGSVAALEDGRLLAERELPSELRNAQSLAPGIRELFVQVGWRPADVQLVAVAVGPGSFTGLRVGVTTAKVLAYAAGAEAMGVITLEAIAERVPADIDSLWTIVDAHREQVFAGKFARGADGRFEWEGDTEVLGIEAWLARLTSESRVSGPMLSKLLPRLPKGVEAVDQACWSPTAAAVGRLAARFHAVGRRDDLWTLAPLYFRASAAEEKRASAETR